MGRDSSISLEDVKGAVVAIKDRNEKVTNRNILNELGSGSLTTIGDFMKIVRADKGKPSATIEKTIDPLIFKTIIDYITRMIAEATAASTLSLTEVEFEYDELIKESKRQISELESFSVKHGLLLSENAALTGRSQQLETENASLKEELTKERSQSEILRIELAKASSRLDDLPRIEEVVENLRTELKTVRARSADDLARAAMEAAVLRESASVSAAKLQGEVTLRESITANLLEVTHQRDIALSEAKKSADITAILRGLMVAKKPAPGVKPAKKTAAV